MDSTTERLPKPSRRNSRINRKYMEALKRRSDTLRERYELYDDQEGDPSRNIQERKAVDWAIGICEEWMGSDPLIDFDWADVPFVEAATIEDTKALIGTKGIFYGRPVNIVNAFLVADGKSKRAIRLTLEEVLEPEEEAKLVAGAVRDVAQERRRLVMEIEIVCSECGQSGGLHEYGEIDITADAWRDTEELTWDTHTNALVVKCKAFIEHTSDYFTIDDGYRMLGWACSHCGAAATALDDLAQPKYGTDRWGRVLDADGQAYGPMVLHPGQQQLDLK